MMLLILKALHIVGFVAWFAGMFYLGRIFVYHVEAAARPGPEKDILIRQFNQMEWKVYKIIVNPAMIITWLAGIAMLVINPAYLQMGWMHVKLTLLLLLSGFHGYSKGQIKKLEKGEYPADSFRFRLLNEVPTLFLVAIAFTAVLGKAGELNYLYLLLGLVVFGALLYGGAKAYQRKRMS